MANEPLESRVARIEADVSQINTRVGNIETDLRGLRSSMDHKFEHLESKFDGRLNAMEAKLGKRLDTMTKWGVALVLTLLSTGATLGGVILNAVLHHGH